MNWEKDKAWADRFDRAVRQLLGEYFIQATPRRVDQAQVADYWVYQVRQFTLACRVRNYAYYLKYPGEVTFRLRRPSGALTEWQKILNGWGDYAFYGFADPEAWGLHAAYLLDLAELRAAWGAEQALAAVGRGTWRYHDHSTRDQTLFRAFAVSAFPVGVVVRQWGPAPALPPAIGGAR